MPPQLPPKVVATPHTRVPNRLFGSWNNEAATDRYVNSRTPSDDSGAGGATVSLGKKRPVRFRVSEPKSPANQLINRAFFRLVVKGAIDPGLYLFEI